MLEDCNILKSQLDCNSIITSKLFTDKQVQSIDSLIIEQYNEISQETLSIFIKFIKLDSSNELLHHSLYPIIKKYLLECYNNKQYIDSLVLLRLLLTKCDLDIELYYYLAEVLFFLNDISLAKEIILLYKENELNMHLKLITLGNFYNFRLKDYQEAIKYYEAYVEIDSTKVVIYTILANLYKKEYGDNSIEKQIEYLKKAYKIDNTNSVALHGLAFTYEKLQNKLLTDKYFKELLKYQPNATNYYNYGAFLISIGKFKKGYEYFTKRFDIDDINFYYPKFLDKTKRWNFVDNISNKTLVVGYEQGFGDTIMFFRFIPQLKKLCKRLILVVQDSLLKLLKSSPIISSDITLLSETDFELSEYDYDFNMALLDAPFALKIESIAIPYSHGYLNVDKNDILHYKNNYIKHPDRLKIGFISQGDKNANYQARDISFNDIKPVIDMIDADFYYFGINNNVSHSKVINLGHTFTDFYQTACAIKNMDIVFCTDNVILNLSGALGVRTLGLFRTPTNFRWYKFDNDTGWYSSVHPLKVKNDNISKDIYDEISNL